MNAQDSKCSITGTNRRHGGADYTFFSQTHFHQLLQIERHRTERSGSPFLLLLLNITALKTEQCLDAILGKINSAVRYSLRETDIRGWYDHGRVIGIIFTEMTSVDQLSIEGNIRIIHARIGRKLAADLLDKITISFHVYPEQHQGGANDKLFDAKLYPDLNKLDNSSHLTLAIKKVMDITGSAAALLLLFPVFLAISVAIKCTSEGPVFFRQERLGCKGKKFTFLKFRSMYENSDSKKHRTYIAKYINEQQNSAVEPGVFKLKDDLRITPLGKWLRKTSLDELPQFINVLKGDMSLIGPRPPIPYEYDYYALWHRKRLLSCKPGITGLWQVMGRSRTTFDDMVRLDLQYIHNWSLGLDLKILLKTPGAIFSGNGAY